MTSPPPLGATDLLGPAGPPPEITLAGKRYALATPSPATLALIEERLLDSAYEVVDAAAERAVTAAARKRLERKTAELDAKYFDRGEHKVGRPEWERVFGTERGVILLVWGCVRQLDAGFSEADARRAAAADPKNWARAVARVMAPFAEAVGAALGADPAKVAAAVAEKLPEAVAKIEAL